MTFTACGNMQISGHELWALGQWELVFAVLLGLASSISGLAAPPEVTEAVQQPSRAVRRRSSPSGGQIQKAKDLPSLRACDSPWTGG